MPGRAGCAAACGQPWLKAGGTRCAGRCGRVADGVCIRLYSPQDFEARPQFTDPEILRTNLASVTIGSGVTNILNSAFATCWRLSAVYFSGNAPAVDASAFENDTNIVYYLPGTTGWGLTFGGRPTALWLPQVQTSDASFGIRTNEFGFNIRWATGMTVLVEACTDLVNPAWDPVATNTLTGGTSYFSEPLWPNSPARFYRLRSP